MGKVTYDGKELQAVSIIMLLSYCISTKRNPDVMFATIQNPDVTVTRM